MIKNTISIVRNIGRGDDEGAIERAVGSLFDLETSAADEKSPLRRKSKKILEIRMGFRMTWRRLTKERFKSRKSMVARERDAKIGRPVESVQDRATAWNLSVTNDTEDDSVF